MKKLQNLMMLVMVGVAICVEQVSVSATSPITPKQEAQLRKKAAIAKAAKIKTAYTANQGGVASEVA